MNYSEAIAKAWKIIWRFKVLWLVGLLASFSGGLNVVPSFNFRFSQGDFPFLGRGSLGFSQVAGWLQSIPAWVWFAGFGVILTLGVLFYLVSLVGQAGVKRGAWQADNGAESLPVGRLFQDSFGYFWRMLGVTLLVGLPGFVFAMINLALFVASLFGFLYGQGVAGVFSLLCAMVPLFCLALPLSWMLSMWSELSTSALVAENLGVFASLRRGWNLFWKKIGSAILVSLFLFVVQIVLGILMGLPVLVVVFPLAFGGFATGLGAGLIGGIVLAILFLVAVGLFVGSLLHAYSGSLWMLAFKRLTAAPAPVAAVAPPVAPAQTQPEG